jgi:hypothetical protein
MIICTMLMLLLGFSGQSTARVSVRIGIPIPPVFVFSAPPELAVVPYTNVYYCPNVDFGIFFYGGYWYRPYDRYWYRSANYDGPWVYVTTVPYALLNLPPDYRIITRGERLISYAELHRRWRSWERDRYWEHHSWGRVEHARHYGAGPSYGYRERSYYGGANHERHYGVAPSYPHGVHSYYGGVNHQRHYGGAKGHGGFHGEGGHHGHERH